MQPTTFYGQQSDERVLYSVRVHRWMHWMKIARFGFGGLVIIGLFWLIAGAAQAEGNLSSMVRLIGFVLGIGLIVIGWWGVNITEKKTKAYITDRRVIRFTATSPWTVVNRSIMWDEVVKVKTYSPSFMWRMMNVGTVVVHARSTIVPVGDRTEIQEVTNDDIELNGVIYYQDLGNYLDKILYTFKQKPTEMGTIKAFVAKPRGKRDE